MDSDLHPQLIHGAQTYLACLRRGQTPNSQSVVAWERFYQICDPLLRRFAISYRVLPDDVDDCVQSTWKEITAALPAFQDDGQPGRLVAWLHVILHSKAMDLCRYRARHPTRRLSPHAEARVRSWEADPATEQEQGFQSELVRRVLAKVRRRVSPTSYRVFRLRSIEGVTVKKVAAKLNLTVEEVRYRCCRVKQKFRGLYQLDLRQASLGDD